MEGIKTPLPSQLLSIQGRTRIQKLTGKGSDSFLFPLYPQPADIFLTLSMCLFLEFFLPIWGGLGTSQKSVHVPRHFFPVFSLGQWNTTTGLSWGDIPGPKFPVIIGSFLNGFFVDSEIPLLLMFEWSMVSSLKNFFSELVWGCVMSPWFQLTPFTHPFSY